MSIRPIDYQVMMPKTSEVSKINNEILQKGQIIHQQENVFTQKQIDRNLRQVNEKQELYKVVADQKGNKNTYSNRDDIKGKDKKTTSENKSSKDEAKNTTKETGVLKNRIDIRI
ncbi:MAG TPA: hypothetical protein GXX37_15045 [Clostridiaceae bacterium]|nr:hypothetical protein [Clostridiaceae bacterium]